MYWCLNRQIKFNEISRAVNCVNAFDHFVERLLCQHDHRPRLRLLNPDELARNFITRISWNDSPVHIAS